MVKVGILGASACTLINKNFEEDGFDESFGSGISLF
jgi:hypothetical protein